MVVLIAASAFFCEGGFSNLAPYTVEQYGVRLGARSAGLGQAANGVGKILARWHLALIAGSGNIVSPQATEAPCFPPSFPRRQHAAGGARLRLVRRRDAWQTDPGWGKPSGKP